MAMVESTGTRLEPGMRGVVPNDRAVRMAWVTATADQQWCCQPRLSHARTEPPGTRSAYVFPLRLPRMFIQYPRTSMLTKVPQVSTAVTGPT